MGQAKQRGTFDQRRNAAIARGKVSRKANTSPRRKPSQGRAALAGMMAALMLPAGFRK